MNTITKLDRQLETQPKEVVFCRRCVVSNQRPRIAFDENGICSACRWFEEKNGIDWNERERSLIELCDKHRSKNGSYDVIVPSSGGKDSAVVAYKLKHTYGMHPLTVTWAPFMYTDIGWKNYLAFKDSGFDNLLAFPDGKLHRKLSRIAFECLGDAWEPFAYGQMSYPFHIAAKFGISLIFLGENGPLEYTGEMKNKDMPHEKIEDWAEEYYKGSGLRELISIGLKNSIFAKEEIQSKTFELYAPPPMEDIKRLGIEMHYWSYYHKWIPQEHYYYAQKNTGFQANPDGRSEGTYSKYASLDDKLDGLHFYMAFIKFGIGRCTSDAAHEIRDGHITRDEGVALVKRYDGEFPKKYFREVLNYLDITEDYFWNVVDAYRAPHLWERLPDGEWKLKHRVS